MRFNLNNRGMGLVEVMVAGAMAAIVSLGVATMMQNSMKESRRMVILDTLKNKKITFDNMMRDPNIWSATLNNNTAAPFTTLKTTNTATPEILFTSPVEFKMYNGDGSLAYDLLGPADTTGPYNGFSEKGTACTNFYATAGGGNDSCPFSYRLLVGVDCMYSSPCMNPSIKLVARLVFNPAPNGTLSNFTNFIAPVAGTSIADTIVDSKYDSVIKRTSTSINRSFRMVSGFSPSSTSGCASGGGGACSTVGARHPRTTTGVSSTGAWDTTANGGYDQTTLVTANTNGTWKFNEKGFYSCTITMPAFATNGFTAYLTNNTTGVDVAQASVTAGQYSQATVTIDAKFNVNSTSDSYEIRQKCEYGGGGVYDACTLGIPQTSAPYSGFSVIVSVNCYKLDRSM